jgi:hypothetical protein
LLEDLLQQVKALDMDDVRAKVQDALEGAGEDDD